MSNLKMMLLALLSLIVLRGTGLAAEDLFDTKAASAHSEKGISCLKARDYNAAVNELEEALSIAPDAETYYYLGYAYYMKGKSGDAESRKKSIENFDRAYELDPRFTPNKYKPAENPVANEPAASAPSKPAPEQQPAKAPEASSPQQAAASEPSEAPQAAPTPKMTDRVRNISNIPAVPN